MKDLLKKIVAKPSIHSRWLNTLSMMENTGAKKIKKCEHPIFVNEVILKHSSEEARHAYYLKKQISKLKAAPCPTYEIPYLLAPKSSYAYLNQLDIDVCRYLKSTFELRDEKLKYAAYLLVTFAIEVRADQLYPEYQEVLKQCKSNVSVRNIITEEEHHLVEMKKQLCAFSDNWETMCSVVCNLESNLFNNWINELKKELN